MANGDSNEPNNILAEIKAASDDLRHNLGEYKGLKGKVEELSGQLKELMPVKDAVTAIQTKLGRPGSPGAPQDTKWKDHMAELIRKGGAASQEAKSYGPEALKLYNIANDTQGGYLVPPEFVNQIIENMANTNPVLGLCWKINTSREIVQIPKETGEPTAYWIGDTQARTDTQNTHRFGLEEIHVRILQSRVDLANTLLEDSPFDIEGFVSRKVAEYQDFEIGKAIIKGEGPNSPLGLLKAAGVTEAASGDASKITADGMLSMGDDLKDAYDRAASYLLSKKTRSAIRRLKDSTGQYLWQPSLVQGAPQTFDGVPIARAFDMPSIEAGAYPVIYGDIGQAYMVAMRVGMTMVRDEITQQNNYVTRLYFNARMGGQVVNTQAISKLKIATTVG